MKWQRVFVEDVAKIVTKGTTPTSIGFSFSKEGIPFLRVNNIQDGKINLGDVLFIDSKTDQALARSRILKKDVIISIAGTIGKTAVIPANAPAMNCNQALAIIRLHNNVDPYYFNHWLNTGDAFRQITGSKVTATISNLSLGCIKKLKIPLPPIDEQRRIAAILDQADAIRRKRQQAIALTDELLRSTFLEMFGDPVINPKGWEVKKLEEVALKRKGAIKCGPFGSQLLISEFVKDGIPVYGIDNVQKNEFVWAKPKYITTEKYEQLKSFSIQDEDVLISRTGTVGRTCVAPPDIPRSILGPNLLKVSLNTNKMLPKYLSYALNHSNPLIEEIKRMSPGATVAVFNTTNLKALRLTIPHINLQSQFVNFTENVELTKQKESNYLTESNNLFNSLLQRAFKGQL